MYARYKGYERSWQAAPLIKMSGVLTARRSLVKSQ
jgi:hypothetical protein